MSDGWRSARVLEFERSAVDADTALLRLRVRAGSANGTLTQPRMVIVDGEQTVRVTAVPSATTAVGSLRLIYAVESELLTDTASYELELPTGRRRRLGEPVAAQPLVDPSGIHVKGADPPDATAAAELADLQVWSGELERRLTEVTNELASTRSEARADQSELATARLALEADGAELGRLRSQLAKSRARIELMEDQAARGRRIASGEGHTDADRLRSERAALAEHVRALAELLVDELPAPAGSAPIAQPPTREPLVPAASAGSESSAGAPPQADVRRLASIRRATLSRARSQAQRELADALGPAPG